MKPQSLSQLKSKLQKVFNEYIREKYSNGWSTNCYTCGKPLMNHTLNCHAGHAFSRGAFSALAFEEDCVRIQCYECNVSKSGNETIFHEKLRKELGEERFNELYAMRHKELKLTHSEYIELIKKYRQKIDMMV